jgi:hypothetical protein
MNQVMISNLMAQMKRDSLNENLVRHMVLTSLRSYEKQYSTEYGEVVLAYDSRHYWRKDVFPFYKQNRKKDREKSGHDWHSIFEVLNKIRDEIKQYFPYKVIEVHVAEADDVISVLCGRFSNEEKVIVSSICDKLFHKSLWNGTKMQEGYYYEDGMVLLNLLKSSKKTMIIDKVGYYYVLSKYSTQRGPYNIRHLESCLYEPDFYYNFFTIHAKEFKEYGVALKCYRSMRGYRFLKHVKNIDYVTKNEYKLKFFNKFSDNYLYLKRTNYYKKISFYEKTAMLIFSINPNIYVLFFYFSKKIANSIKRRFLAKKN